MFLSCWITEWPPDQRPCLPPVGTLGSARLRGFASFPGWGSWSLLRVPLSAVVAEAGPPWAACGGKGLCEGADEQPYWQKAHFLSCGNNILAPHMQSFLQPIFYGSLQFVLKFAELSPRNTLSCLCVTLQ